MQNEFKYIPYDGKDTNIRGLIKNGNVYSLTRGMSGLLLPDDPMKISAVRKRTGHI